MLDSRDPTDASPHWALCGARYFDTHTLRFRAVDIEMHDGRIAALLPPGDSHAPLRIDGTGLTCVPGLVGALSFDRDDGTAPPDWHAYTRAAMLSGITTIGVVTSRPGEIAAHASRVGLRAELFCDVRDRIGDGRAHGDHDLLRAVEAYRTLAAAGDGPRIRISPAITSQAYASSRLTVHLHALAQASGKRLLVNLDSGRPEHDAFHAAHGCSGTLLLHCLNVLDASTLAIADSGLSRHDVDLLVGSSASIGLMDDTPATPRIEAARHVGRLRRLAGRGRGTLLCRHGDAVPLAAPLAAPDTLGLDATADLPPDELAELLIGSMTRGGSRALGLCSDGAPDDLVIYDAPADTTAPPGPDSRSLLALLASRRPRSVMTDGRWRVRDYALVP